jgi:hypothetical protein
MPPALAYAPAPEVDLLTGFVEHTAMGRRDYAMLPMLSRLGLRAGELVALRLDDVDWRAGEIDSPARADTGNAYRCLTMWARRWSASCAAAGPGLVTEAPAAAGAAAHRRRAGRGPRPL